MPSDADSVIESSPRLRLVKALGVAEERIRALQHDVAELQKQTVKLRREQIRSLKRAHGERMDDEPVRGWRDGEWQSDRAESVLEEAVLELKRKRDALTKALSEREAAGRVTGEQLTSAMTRIAVFERAIALAPFITAHATGGFTFSRGGLCERGATAGEAAAAFLKKQEELTEKEAANASS